MKENGKKILIYTRYIFPVFSHIAMLVMAFVPSYIFIVGGKAGDRMSLFKFISLYWEKCREVLFGVAEHSESDVIFAKILFTMIIVFSILFIFSFAISVWTAIVAFRVFLSDDEESAERGRRFLLVFIPNRIVAFILSGIGICISMIPYCIKPITSLTGAGAVKMVLEFADVLFVGIVLLIISLILTVVSSYLEKYMNVNIFEKVKGEEDEEDEEEYDDEEYDEEEDEDGESELFDDED